MNKQTRSTTGDQQRGIGVIELLLAAALRAAQLEMIKQKRWASPFFWAAFTMQGEWR